MTAMTPSIKQVPKLIFHDVDPGDPPCPLKRMSMATVQTVILYIRNAMIIKTGKLM